MNQKPVTDGKLSKEEREKASKTLGRWSVYCVLEWRVKGCGGH